MPSLPSQFYGRMFPSLRASSHPEDDLINLATHMLDTPATRPTDFTELSGYLYWGQFIDHDLTLDLTPLMTAASVPPEARINRRSPFFDLDSMYGDGPLATAFLYQLPSDSTGRTLPPGNERFLIGKTTPSGKLFDVPRSEVGRPLLVDARNEEHMIIAQFHILLLRFHNNVMHALDQPNPPDVGLPGAPKFTQARRLVTWHYQYLVLNEFLPKFLNSAILDEIRASYRNRADWCSKNFFIPIEFALAAFRFGHSMVRGDYNIRIQSNHEPFNLSLSELLRRNSMRNPPVTQLSDEYIIDWSLFFPDFGRPVGNRNVMHALDVLIARDLHSLPGPIPIDPGPSPRMVSSLPALTLLRGQRSGLPSGQHVADALGERGLTPDELLAGQPPDLSQFLSSKPEMLTETPLWFYILQEAAVTPPAKLRLGPVGTRIVAETIIGSLAADSDSVLNAGDGWTPPPWPALPNAPVDTISKLVLAALA